ncbi:L-seryl-tRNA(Sec) selenium transferase [Pseudalkalibacillus hwajinpoensis]|uniref:L-seryl-tRNA(Sec) selenium transferase n=1 Tax=Guptibacillus hwajinpoensis TaxID=208199 RepID=UPI001CD6BE1B|nr:L-seryl-tRNA(Sec) selenium transferase [Pseudalkalibacillus hwajinpoensis]MCA0990323.1 L-seryl-tRNA(Sec) selenium transferase [Pseudalkalibacillus hwajinpoensis]
MKLLRELPPIHQIQETMVKDNIGNDLPQKLLKQMVQQEVDDLRASLLNETYSGDAQDRHGFQVEIIASVQEKLTRNTFNLVPVINATGVVLHTNLGRARLSDAAIDHMIEVAKSYSTLEYNLAEGRRGSRHTIVEEAVCKATGAEAAMIVNNNAAAVFMILSGLAKEKEVVVSRGELVEIGGSFRVSSIMEESGARLKEVGTTNKTHPADYEQAVNDETAMIMKVHRSNFAIVGFTAEVEREQLASIANEQQIIFYEDLGSGALYDYRKDGIGEEPTVQETLAAGADLVSFSGDKLLGGPQAGIIAGKKELVDRLKKHQLARVLRVDKFTLAALEATLLEHLYEEANNIPAIRDITVSPEEVRKRAIHFKERLETKCSHYQIDVEAGVSQVGGGTMPAVELPTSVVAIRTGRFSVNDLEEKLRRRHRPIITRIKDEKILIDLRTVTTEEEEVLLSELMNISNE